MNLVKPLVMTLVSGVLIVAAALVSAPAALAKAPIPTPADVPMMGDVDAYLLGTLYKDANHDAGLAAISDKPAFKALVKKYDLKLFGGPMLGCVTDHSARFWVRTPEPATVQVVLSPNKDLSGAVKSQTAKTGPAGDFTALLDVDDLKPWTTYYYDVLVNGASACKASDVYHDQPPAFKTYPAKGQKVKFDVGFGGGARYVPQHESMWDTIASSKLAAFLFLGDNVYIDQPNERNMQRVHYYRRQLRPEFRRFVASTGIYAIYDDHDFGKNDVAGGLDPFDPTWKVPVWRVFKENWVNPYYGGGAKQPGCWFDFTIGDVQFIMLDNRYYRNFKEGQMLGPVQQKWLLDKLSTSKAKFKVVANGTLWTEYADKGGKDSWYGRRKPARRSSR